MSDTDAWAKILIAVIVIMSFLWWQGDRGRIKWVNELQETIAQQEEKIEELEATIEYLRDEYE